ncbi:MAG: hypothetical protein HY897_19740 [Deltaproteobacteria bacterium]|nr:hypothetical protein [Deltaproteobacteria bacterium]
MRAAILDTSIYVGHFAMGWYAEVLAGVRQCYVVRHSAVVLSELVRGASTRATTLMIAQLCRLAGTAWIPEHADWLAAGSTISRLGRRLGWEERKMRDIQNDVLIALTARRFGAVLYTANRGDFSMIRDLVQFEVVFVDPPSRPAT